MKNSDFEGSIFEKLGFDSERCPHCKSHLKGGICLNACHLSVGTYRKMHRKMMQIFENTRQENEDADSQVE